MTQPTITEHPLAALTAGDRIQYGGSLYWVQELLPAAGPQGARIAQTVIGLDEHGQRHVLLFPNPGAPALLAELAADRLTEQELLVLAGVADGLNLKTISRNHGWDEHSAERASKAAVAKLAARDQAHAVAIALRTGLLRMATADYIPTYQEAPR